MLTIAFLCIYVTINLTCQLFFTATFYHDDAILYYELARGSVETEKYSIKALIFPKIMSAFAKLSIYEMGKAILALFVFLQFVGNPIRRVFYKKEIFLLLLSACMISYIAMTGLKEIMVVSALIFFLGSPYNIKRSSLFWYVRLIPLTLIRPILSVGILLGLIGIAVWRYCPKYGIISIILLSTLFSFDFRWVNHLIPGLGDAIILEFATRTNYVFNITGLRDGYLNTKDFFIILVYGLISPLPTFSVNQEVETSFTVFVVAPALLGLLISRSNLKLFIKNASNQYLSTLIILFLISAFSILTLFPEILRLKMSLYVIFMYGLTKATKKLTADEA